MEWKDEYSVKISISRIMRDIKNGKRLGKVGRDYDWSVYQHRSDGKRGCTPLISKEVDTKEVRELIMQGLSERRVMYVSSETQLQIRWGKGFMRIEEMP